MKGVKVELSSIGFWVNADEYGNLSGTVFNGIVSCRKRGIGFFTTNDYGMAIDSHEELKKHVIKELINSD